MTDQDASLTGNKRSTSTGLSSRLSLFFQNPVLWPAVESRIEAFIEEKTKKPWNDPRTLDRLRTAITRQKDLYWQDREKRRITYTKGYHILAYLAYHAPVYCVQAAGLLFWMSRMGLTGPVVRLLDVGAGPGMVSLAASQVFPGIGVTSTVISSIEREQEHIEAYAFLTSGPDPSVTINPPERIDLVEADPCQSGPYDIIVFQNVVTEIMKTPEEISSLIFRYSEALAPHGSILIVEPAERESAERLRVITSEAMRKGLFVYSPCTFLWGSRCRPDRCWSFAGQPGIRPTRLMEALATGEEGYRFRNTDIKYSFAVLRRERSSAVTYRVPRNTKAIRCSALGKATGRDVMIIASVMSGNLGDEDNFILKVCDGTGGMPIFAVLPRHQRSDRNAGLLGAGYGDVILLDQVRVRFNRERQAYNLLVSRFCHVVILERRQSISNPAGKGTKPEDGRDIHTFMSAGDIRDERKKKKLQP